MYWLSLSAAILTEIIGTICMKQSVGFTRLVPSILVFIFYAISLSFMVISLKKIAISIAYAVWSGAGTGVIAAVGMLYFREEVTALKIVSIGLIIAGVVGLQLSSKN